MNKEIFPLGALNKITGEYVYPKIANKKDKYICSDCNKDLVFCQGKIKCHHFRHKADDRNKPCNYYDKPTEAQIHKDAKLLLKNLLERKIIISFTRLCMTCKNSDEFEIPEITETSEIFLEYRFSFDDGLKIADVAYIDNDEIVCIFEIYNTHRTSNENRPEPWFEIDAKTLINTANDISSNMLKISCVRQVDCDECIQRKCRYFYKLTGEKKCKCNDYEYGAMCTECLEKIFFYEFRISRYIYHKLTGEKKCNYDYQSRKCNCNSVFGIRGEKSSSPFIHGPEFFNFNFNDGDSDGYSKNKKILELFEDMFCGYHAIIKTYKVAGTIFIISEKAYNKYDYWKDENYVYDTDTLNLPYIKKIDISSTFNTPEIIEWQIIQACKKLYSIKKEKIQEIQKIITSIETEKQDCKNKIDNDDDADMYRNIRYKKQEDKYKRSLKHEIKFIENDVEYIIENNIASIRHKITNTKIRKSLVNNKTYFNGKWRDYISIELIISWYHSNSDFCLTEK